MLSKKIGVQTAVANGPTNIASFDAALQKIGLHDVNLLYLSSVIPLNHQVVDGEAEVEFETGDKIYVVAAIETAINRPVWTGVCWTYFDDDGSNSCQNGGLFLEAHGNSEEYVRRELKIGMADMMERRGRKFTPVKYRISGTDEHLEDTWTTAMTIAVVGSEGWL